MTDIETLRRNAEQANDELRQAEAKESDRRNAELVGRCFKYHNAGGGCDSKWWLYACIIAVKDGALTVFSFQHMPNGQIEIETARPMRHISFGDHRGYLPISNTEFDAAWSRLRSTIAGLTAREP